MHEDAASSVWTSAELKVSAEPLPNPSGAPLTPFQFAASPKASAATTAHAVVSPPADQGSTATAASELVPSRKPATAGLSPTTKPPGRVRGTGTHVTLV